MPYKTDKLALNDPFLKRSCKLLPCQKEMVKYRHELGESIHSLSKVFKVSRRLIQFIIYPNRLEKSIVDRFNRGGSKIYYDREKHNNAIKNHRQYKHKTLN